jgi:hypothetical protein
MTVPAGTVSSKTGSPCCGTRSSCSSAVVAWSSVIPTSSGSTRGAGPVLTNNSNGLFCSSSVPSPGSVRITTPWATSSLASRVTTVSQSNPEIWFSASASVNPASCGTW